MKRKSVVKNVETEFKQSLKFPYHDNLGLTVYSCGIHSCHPDYAWGPGIRDHYLIHYILSGKGTYNNGEHCYALGPGDGFLCEPDKTIVYTADHDDPWKYCWVGFNGADAQRLVGLTSLSHENPVFHYDKDDRLAKRLQAIYEMDNTLLSSDVRRLSNLMAFLAELIDIFGKAPPEHKRGYRYVEKSVRFIDFNYSRSINIDDIASNVGISRSHLYRLFMEHFSLPPNEYLIRYRISKAAEMLEKGGITVSEAAFSSGFSDQLYFSRVFKKYKGVPPSKYAALRKENAKDVTQHDK